MRMRVQSLALLSGLRIQHCHKLWGHSYSSDPLLLGWQLQLQFDQLYPLPTNSIPKATLFHADPQHLSPQGHCHGLQAINTIPAHGASLKFKSHYIVLHDFRSKCQVPY